MPDQQQIIEDLINRVAKLEADVDHLKPPPKKSKWRINPDDHQTIWTHGPAWNEPVDRP